MRLVAVALLAGVLNACGGAGGGDDCARIDASRSSALPGCTSSSTGSTGTTAGTTASTVQFLVSSQQLNSAGTAPVDVTVIARDANGQAISGRAVQFTVADPENTAYISNFSQTTGTTHSTGANGQLTASLNVGSSKANRDITLTAKVDDASASNVVRVTGTTIAVSGSNALVFGASTQFNAVLTDSSGKPVSSVPLKVTSSAGNTVTLASLLTDASGKAVLNFTGTKAGADTITVSAGGAITTYTVTVSGNGFAFTTPPTGTMVGINEDLPVSVRWTDNGQPVANKLVSFNATRGTFTPTQVATDANGVATASLKSASPGPSTISASGPAGSGVAGSMNVSFESRMAVNSLDLQADKTTIAVNPPGISGNVATLTAVVRDVNNNRLANKLVNFRIEQDPTQGALSTASAITDVNGIAKSQYIPSSQSSPTNGVVIVAQVAESSIQSRPLSLTVANQNLFVRIGTDNTVETNTPNYIKKYSAFVTDAAGNPVPNATVQFLIRPRQDESPSAYSNVDNFLRRTTGDYAYYKGTYVWVYPFWKQTNGTKDGAPVGCNNEDVNFNGIILDAGEDFNKNGMLDTGNSYSVNASAVTNSAGFALASITYPKDRANWTAVTLKATAQVSGTEATASASFVLGAASEDLNREDIFPPGYFSPYGTGPNCETPN